MSAITINYSCNHAELSAPHATTMGMALHFLGLSICFDYLSKGQGHQQSRRVVAERSAERLQPRGLAATTVPAHVPIGSGHRQFDPELRYLRDVAARPRLTSSEEYCLALRMKDNDAQAHDALIEANLGLVVMLARRYQRPGVPLLDLVAEGNFGLFTAAKRFDPELGYRFATYAKWWVIQAIQMAIPRLVGVVRLPASHHGRRDDRFMGPSPSQDILSPRASPTDEDMTPHAEYGDLSEPSSDSHTILISSACVDTQATARTNFPSQSATQDVLDSIAAPEAQEPPQAIMSAQRALALQRALDSLPGRDRIIISKRFGLDHDQGHVCTLDQLGREFGISNERVRQIERATLAKLKQFLRQAGVEMDA